jgi:hypothetical protein
MLMRQFAPDLRPGAYLIGAAPASAQCSYAELETLLRRLVDTAHRS